MLYNDAAGVEPEWVNSITEGLRSAVDGIFVMFNDK